MTRSTPDTDPLGAAIRAAAGEIRAPEALRARVADQRAAAPRGVPLALLAGALAVVACAAALVLVVGLFGGSNTIEGPTLARAADAALGTAKGPPPVVDQNDTVLVRAGIAGVQFPYWDDQFGLHAVAMRREAIATRSAMTVEYRGGGQRIGYTIVAGRPLAVPSQARTMRRGSLRLATFTRGRATVVTWERAGHTCVLASRDTSVRRLIALAAWTGGGRVGGYATG